MEEKFTFVVQKIDFWHLLISDSSWGLMGMVLYLLIVYRELILKESIFKVVWKNRNLIGYSFVITTLIAIVYQSFPDIKQFFSEMPFYNETLGKLGFVGVGAMAARFASGNAKNNLKDDIFKKKTGIDPNEPLI